MHCQVNILVSSTGAACLADFGLSTTEESQRLWLSTTSTRAAGTLRWLAPELLTAESEEVYIPCHNTRASDVYAFGMVGYEVYLYIFCSEMSSEYFLDFFGSNPLSRDF